MTTKAVSKAATKATKDGSSFRDDLFKDINTDFDNWDENELANFLRKAKLGDYSEMFITHKISGRLAPLLTDAQLKEMGVSIVGDRLRIKSLIQNMKWKIRYNTRSKILWEGTERLYFSDASKLCWTCCGIFPDDPSTYKLTTTHLKIKTVDPLRCGPIKLCCSYDYNINNVDLSKVDDVDVVGVPSPCCIRILCCAPGKEIVEVKSSAEGKLLIVLQKGQGDHVSTLIMNQIEEAQVIERD